LGFETYEVDGVRYMLASELSYQLYRLIIIAGKGTTQQAKKFFEYMLRLRPTPASAPCRPIPEFRYRN
jgi:hypothetical protein